MKKSLLISILLMFAVSCVTRPQVIDKKYMVNMTDNEEAMINDLESKVVDKNNELEATKKEYDAVLKEGAGEDKKLSDLEDELFKMKDELRLYKAQKDTAKIDETTQKMEQKKLEIDDQKKVTEFYSTKKAMYLSNVEVKQAELSVILAQTNYEKSKIARRNRDKEIDQQNAEKAQNPEPEKKGFFDKFKKSGPKSIDVSSYEKYYIDQQENLRKTILANKKAIDEYNKAKDTFEQRNADKAANN
ncbi:MAG: hypothetical protein JW982_09500 [Spirochaetes bacterium]|nr:hypothetical protein [Spirochaetota bacterium]